MSITKAQFQRILDSVFNNGLPDTEYTNTGDYTAIQMYMNSLLDKADFLRREDENYEYFIAILQTETPSYVEGGQIIAYTCKEIKDADLVSVDDLKEYNKGISKYVPMKQYIRNLCVFLGVNMSENFNKENPLIYNDIVKIVQKYCTLENKGLAYWGRTGTTTPVYKSYVPVMCLVDLAILFNGLRLFSVSRELYVYGELFTACIYNSGGTTMRDFVQYLPKAGDLFTFQSKKEYLDNLKTVFSSNTYIDLLVDEFKYTYENEIDWQNSIILTNIRNNTYLVSYIIPRSCLFLQAVSGSSTDYICKNPSSSFYVYNNTEDYDSTKIVVQYNTSTQDFTNSKTITHITKVLNNYTQNITDLSDGFSNIKCDKYYKTYMTDVYTGTSTSNYYIYNPISKFDLLEANTEYSNLLFLGYDDLIKAGIAPQWISFLMKLKITEDLTITDNDFVFGYITQIDGVNKNRITIVKNAKGKGLTSSKILGTINTSIVAVQRKRWNTDYSDITPEVITGTNGYNKVFKNSRTITFSESLEYLTYEVDSLLSLANITVIADSTGDTFEIYSPSTAGNDTRGLYFTNLGELQNLSSDSLNGLSLIEGSNYPSSVIDYSSFINTYNTATYANIHNPYYENEELIITDLHTDVWVNCSTTKTIPDNQASAQDADLDDVSDDDWDDEIKEIDASTDDDDEEDDPDSEGEKDPGENEGNNTIPTIDDVFKYNMSQFETQWLLSEAEFQALGLLINSGDFLQSISTVIASVLGIDPLSGIVSVQIAPLSLIPSVDLTLKDMVIRGIEMTGNVKFKDTGLKSVTVQGYTLEENVKEFDLGEELIDEKFGSYMDLVDTQMTLYLPFVGNIDLDIRDFYLGKLWIKGFVESFTGQIVYYIISKDKPDTKGNLQTKIVATLTGNCYSTIPITQDSYGSFMNSFTRG